MTLLRTRTRQCKLLYNICLHAKRVQSSKSPIALNCVHHSSSTPKPGLRTRWPRLFATTVVTAGLTYWGAFGWPTEEPSALDPVCFSTFEIVSKEPVSPTSSIFTLRPTKSLPRQSIYWDAWQKGVWSVELKQPQLQIARDYTPLPPIPSFDQGDKISRSDDELRFLIRKERHGEVSGYLHSLREGCKIEVRGPKMELGLDDAIQEVLFIAGGTAVAPALQVAYSLFKVRERSHPVRMHIMWANRRREDCIGGKNHNPRQDENTSFYWWWKPSSERGTGLATDENSNDQQKGALVKELENFKARYPGQFTVEYFVDEENGFIGSDAIMRSVNEAFDHQADSINKDLHGGKSPALRAPRKRLLLVSGPDGFVSHLAGAPKTSYSGRPYQGSLGGVLERLNLKGWSMEKL